MDILKVLVDILFWFALLWLLTSNYRKYRNSAYFKETGNKYLSSLFDKEVKSEYLTSKCFTMFRDHHRELYHCRIPRPDGTAVGIDAVVVHATGIHVFAAMHQKGRIVGDENQSSWTAKGDGKSGSGEGSFYNPVMQNEANIRYLRAYLGDDAVPVYSYVVFGRKTVLDDVHVSQKNCSVLRRQDLLYSIFSVTEKAEQKLDAARVDEIYARLKPLTEAQA